MSVIFTARMESNLSEWTTFNDTEGDITWSASAGLAGTAGGMNVLVDNTTAMDYYKTFSPANTTGKVRVRYYIDPNSIPMDNAEEIRHLLLWNSGVAMVAMVALIWTTSDGYKIVSYIYNDAAGASTTTAITITDAPHYVEVYLQRATNSTSNDGRIDIWVDGGSQQSVTGIDNYDRFNNLTYLGAGAFSFSGTPGTGSFFIDEVVANDDGSEIGPFSAGTSVSITDTASGTDNKPTISASLTVRDSNTGTDVVSPYKPSVAYRSSDNDGINEGFSDTVLGAIKPVGLCVDDVLLLFVCYKSNSNSINITFDTGDWKEINDTHVINTTPTEDLHGRVFWKRAVDTDVLDSFYSWVVTFSSLVKNPNLIITAYSGATKNSIPCTVVATTSGNGNCTLPSITTSRNSDLIVGFVGNSVYSSWSSSSLTERQDIRCVASYDGLQPLAGASGTKLISSSITDEYIGIILNLSTESIVKSTSETGIGSDSKPTISASLTLSDVRTALDYLGLSASLTLSDVGTIRDIASILTSLQLLESGIGTDRLSNLTSLLSIIDSGQGTDVVSVLIALLKLVTDTGSGSDRVLNLLASLSVSELSRTLDAVTQLVSLTLTETGRGVDSSVLAASLGLSDTGTVIDYLGLSALLSLIDTGISLDAIANVIASLSITDTSSASDIESILKAILILITDTGLGDWGTGVELILDIADSITGIDTISTLASLLVSDSGTTTELINVLTAVIVAIQEYGSGSDQVANLLASLSVNEISTITEILLQLISLSVSDVGREIEETTLSASLSQLDTASGRDALSDLLSALGITELGTGGDLLTLLASLSLSDAGSGSDIVNVITATLKAVADVASGLDGVSISASMSLVDNGSGVDNLSLTVSLTIRDTGLGTDAISVLITALKQILDAASGTDRLTISASLNIPEMMYGIDAPTIAASLIGYDIGISSDSPQIQASLTLTDTSSASDILTVLQTALKIVQDLASGSDFVGSISASIPVSDNVLGADQIAQLLASLMVTDFGTGVDVVVSYDITTQIIKISFIIKKSAITFAFAYPRIEFSFLDGG